MTTSAMANDPPYARTHWRFSRRTGVGASIVASRPPSVSRAPRAASTTHVLSRACKSISAARYTSTKSIVNHEADASLRMSSTVVARASAARMRPLMNRRRRPEGRMFSTSDLEDDDAGDGEQRADDGERRQALAEEQSPKHEGEHRRRGR